MKYSIYFIVIFSFYFLDISLSLSEEYRNIYDFDNILNISGWNGIDAYEIEEHGYALQISPNAEINISTKNLANSLGTVSFNYSIPGNFNYKCKLNFSIDGVPHYLSAHEKEGTSPPYSVDCESKEHVLSWNCTCQDCPNMENGPRCIIDDVAFSNIEISLSKSTQEKHLDPSDRELNDDINKSSNKTIKLAKGVHSGQIIIGLTVKNIKIEPEIDPKTGKYVEVIIDGNYAHQAIKLIDTSGITLNNISLRGADKALILENSSGCTIKNLDISNYYEDGIYILNCKDQTNTIGYNKIHSDDNETLPFNIENANNTAIIRNEIDSPEYLHHYYLDNSYNNRIIIMNSCKRCPLISNHVECILEDCYNFINKSDNTCNSTDAEKILGNSITQ